MLKTILFNTDPIQTENNSRLKMIPIPRLRCLGTCARIYVSQNHESTISYIYNLLTSRWVLFSSED